MKPIASTVEILAFKMLGESINKKWIDWAYDMLCTGFETENLIELAGEQEPYNQFELQRLTDKIFHELNLNWDDKELVYKNYISYLITEALNGKSEIMNVLVTLKDLYIDGQNSLQDFAMLYWAKDDLSYMDNQYYLDGATRENIDSIIEDYFNKWLKNNRKKNIKDDG